MARYIDLDDDEIIYCGNDGEYERYNIPTDAPTADVTKLKWIPYKDKRPTEKEEKYLVQTDNGYVCECRWTNVNHMWTGLTTNWHWHIFDIPQYSKVVAWMALPKPYIEEVKE